MNCNGLPADWPTPNAGKIGCARSSTRCTRDRRTRQHYLGIWRHLDLFLKEHKIATPRHLTREHCYSYLVWRTAQGHGNSPTRRAISRNRMISELKVLSRLMNEAVL